MVECTSQTIKIVTYVTASENKEIIYAE